MLLCRNAEDLYWLGRNLERAEAVSRLVGEHTNLLVDLPVDVESDWAALLAITGSATTFTDRYERAGETEIVTFLLADLGNPGSVLRSLNAARESLRVTRPLLPRSAWECLNRLHLDAVDELSACTARSTRARVTESVVTACQQFVGLLDGTMERDDAHRFWELGRLVERADMTTRVLDVRACSLMHSSAPATIPPADRSPYEDVRWLGVLQALGAGDAFHRARATSVSGPEVVTFLLEDERFPRSTRHCAARIDQLLGQLPERPEPALASGGLAVRIEQLERRWDAASLHEHLDSLQQRVIELHDSLELAYFSSPPTTRSSQPDDRTRAHAERG